MSSAQIIQLFRAAAFDPETVSKLCNAYDTATRSLHESDRPPRLVNETIAQRIIQMAENGEHDPVVLAKSALSSLGLGRDG